MREGATELLRGYPMIWIAVALIIGIIIGNTFSVAISIPILICCLLLIGMLICHRRNRYLFICFGGLFFISTGVTLTEYRLQKIAINIDEEKDYIVRLTDYPSIKENYVQVESEIIDEHGKHKILLSLRRDSTSDNLTLGDVLLVRGAIKRPQALNPGGFDYGRYLVNNGFSGTLWSYYWKKISNNTDGLGLLIWGKQRQHKITNYYRSKGIQGRELGVISALTIGDRDWLDADTRKSFSAAGAMHILAVSGLHVGLIYGVLLIFITLFGRIKPLRNQYYLQATQSAIIIILLWVYAIITGMSPSVVRATLMFSLGEIGRGLHKLRFGLNIVGAAATIILLFNPLALFSVSFQLSFAAVISIMTIGQKLDQLSTSWTRPHKNDNKIIILSKQIARYFIGLLVISFAAQLGTLPLTMYYFNQISVYFWLTNLVMIPLVQFIAIPSMLLLPIFPPATNWIFSILCNYIVWVESLPYSTIQVWISLLEMLMLMGVVICSYKQQLHYLATCFIIAFGIMKITDISKNNSRHEMIIYANHKNDIVQFIDNRQQYVITNDSLTATQLTAVNALKYNLYAMQPIDYKVLQVNSIGKTIIINDNILENRQLPHNIDCDMLVLGDIGHVGTKRLMQQINPQRVVILGSMPEWKANQLNEICDSLEIDYINIIKKGALLIKL